jgi:hypothetical protein
MARLDSPPLTTVAQPFTSMAGEAIHVVLEQLAGRPVADCVELPALFLVRQSCGCGVRTRLVKPVVRPSANVPAADYLRSNGDALARALVTPLCITSPEGLRTADRLLAALAPALAGNPDPFLRTVEQLLESSDNDPANCRALENAIARLRDELRCCNEPELEDLWHDARDLIAHRAQRGQVQQRIDLDNDYLRIVDLNRHLTRAVDLPSLKQALLRMMPSLGISNASFSRYAQGSTAELEPWVCMVDGRPFEPPAVRFAARQLVPAGIWRDELKNSLIISSYKI